MYAVCIVCVFNAHCALCCAYVYVVVDISAVYVFLQYFFLAYVLRLHKVFIFSKRECKECCAEGGKNGGFFM